ncbi:MAG: hypothetical protein ABIX19_08630, partial [Gemmatimonadaceae bacterium]
MLATLRRWFHALREVAGFTPTRRLAYAIAAVAPLFLVPGPVGRWLGVVALVAVGAALVVDVASLPRRERIEVEREFPETIGVGDRVEGHYTVRSDWS